MSIHFAHTAWPRPAFGARLAALTANAAALAWLAASPGAAVPARGFRQQSPGPSTETAPPGEPSGTITGQISAEEGGRIPEMVVYLEAVDPRNSFAAPTDPAIISQKGAQFSPSLLVICVGQQVNFLNDEDRPVEHNVFSKSQAKPFDLGLYSPGGSKQVTFDRPGAVNLHCSIHQNMNGVIFVSPTPFFARVDNSGRYTISGVPAGEYRLRTWQRIRRFSEHVESLTMAKDGSISVDVRLSRNR